MKISSSAQTVFDFLSLRDSPKRADVIFVLGNSSDGPVRKAAALYKAGYAPKIAFTSSGGTFGGNVIWDMAEAEYYSRMLRELGISEEAMFYPKDKRDETTNTLMEA